MTNKCDFPGTGGLRRRRAFTLLELLVSVAVLALLLIGLTSLLSMTMRSYKQTTGKLETFEASRAAFDTMARTLRQATLLSTLGYDDPKAPAKYLLKSDLHFVSGRQSDLALSLAGTGTTHAVFFQAPLGVSDNSTLAPAISLLNTVGYFIAYGKDPDRPAVIEDLTPTRYRYRLFQYLPPREKMTVYEKTLKTASEGGDSFLVGDDTYSGTDWFTGDVNTLEDCRVLAENVVALAILPVSRAETVPADYTWNSRKQSNQLPGTLKIAMAVVDETSFARLENSPTAPDLGLSGFFTDPAKFDEDVTAMEGKLAGHSPPLNYRIFRAEIPLPPANANL